MRAFKQWHVLGGLFAVFVGMVFWRQTTMVLPQEVPLKFKSGQSLASRSKVEDEDAFELALPRASQDESSSRPRRNIFASLDTSTQRESKKPQKTAHDTPSTQRPIALASPVLSDAAPPSIEPAEPALPIPPTGPPLPSPEELAAQAEREQHALRVKEAREQMTQFRYLGYLNQNGERKGFLGKGHDIYIVRQGDRLDGGVLVAAIDANTVTLRDTAQNLETTLQLKSDSSSEPS